jgi:hypothetical protein
LEGKENKLSELEKQVSKLQLEVTVLRSKERLAVAKQITGKVKIASTLFSSNLFDNQQTPLHNNSVKIGFEEEFKRQNNIGK